MYPIKVKSYSRSSTPQKTLFKLAWKVKELEELTSDFRQLTVDLTSLMERMRDPKCDVVRENVAEELGSIHERIVEAV